MKKIIILSALAFAVLATASYFTVSQARRRGGRYHRGGWGRRYHGGYRRGYYGSDAALVGTSLLTGAIVASSLADRDDVSGKEAVRAVRQLEDATRADLKRIDDRLSRIEDSIDKLK